ncbi:helix-turn-helix domain-containing protein [Neobacillus sp. LXY-4]|uniref:helix-turn-helix domain-containing protein n=1 Tax=Neobacillus sp. LXY-4 TaxID=3379826 RepID=UPI003EE200D4
MKMSKTKLILHPVRMKIIQSLINGKKFTVNQIAERVKDVPQATLYRQLNTLLEADLIEVVQENQVRGTIEKVYALKEQSVHSMEEFLSLNKEEHLELFLTFTTELVGQFENYLAQDDIDLVKDGAGYRIAKLYLTDLEYLDLVKGIGSLIQKASLNEPSPERKAKNIATIIIPE